VVDDPVEPVEPVELFGEEELGARYWPGGPPEVMFLHFFGVAALDELDEPDELDELLDALFEVVGLELAAEVLIPDVELDFGSV
jgi:hypothetical protein